MSARLTTAFKVGRDAANLLRSAQQLSAGESDLPPSRIHPGGEVVLLTLAMELTLKAWVFFDHDSSEKLYSHNLIKLFEMLRPETQMVLDNEFKRSVAPHHPNGFFIDFSIRHVLFHNQDAFKDWRYIHEREKSLLFERNVFEATVEMLLREFQKKYITIKLSPPLAGV